MRPGREPSARALTPELSALRAVVLDSELVHAREIATVAETHRASAINFAHYLALRSADLRRLQHDLSCLGLSSLGRTESHVLSNLERVLALVRQLAGERPRASPDAGTNLTLDAGEALLERNAERLLGPAPPGRPVRIMVTMPTAAASNPDLIEELLASGMDLMRINCAHDERRDWENMVLYLRAACRKTGRSCRVYADLAGPKLRTGALATEQPIELQEGEHLLLTFEQTPGRAGSPSTMSCNIPEALAGLEPGHSVFLDDGKLEFRVIERRGRDVLLALVRAGRRRPKVRPNLGINLPETTITTSAITSKDRRDLDFVVEFADLVGLSFVRETGDVHRLIDELAARSPRQPGVVVKIETTRAFEHLPELVFAVLCAENCGVMLARGDLAVEVGFERMAEVQEEILCLCEAAHLPVIWATEVLDRLTKKGLPSRAEVTDAAMSSRAECVMLNKGPRVTSAVGFLDGVLRRMVDHQHKKSTLLPRLPIAG